MDWLAAIFIVAVIVGIPVAILKMSGMGHPFGGGPLRDARVEWEVYEATGYSGGTQWNWSVSVGDKSKGGYEFGKWEAMTNARNAARRMIGEGERYGKTRPCPLCGKPSRAGKDTDTDECSRLLDSARIELQSLPKAQL